MLHPPLDGGEQLLLNDHGETVSTGKELVVINSSVMDADAIIGELAPNQEVLRLDSSSDAMDQILAYLNSSAERYDAIHLVSHGNDGYFVLNGEIVDSDHFDAAEWAAVGAHLTDDGDIMIYGCNLAESEAGQHLVGMIADASGADVAASDDATGFGGDWDLEFHHGVIETASISVSGYEYRLNNILVTSDLNDGAGSLRDAIDNRSQSGDEITFVDSVHTITLQTEIVIDKNLTISGDSVNYTVLEGNGSNRIFTISNAAVTLENLTFQNAGSDSLDGGAIYVDADGSLAVNHCLFEHNQGDSGGAIYNAGNVQIVDSTLAYNTAASNGGAVSNYGTFILVNSTLYGNRAEGGGIGGGIYSSTTQSEKFVVVDSTLAGNSAKATNGGGGIYMDPSGNNASLEVLNSIVVGNYTGDDPIAGNVANDIGGDVAKFSRSFLNYGVITLNYNSSDGESNIASDINKTFHAQWGNSSGKWELVNRNDGAPIFQNGMIQIYADSVGATEGTLVGWLSNSAQADFNKLWEGNFYYRSSWGIDNGTWVSMTVGANIGFVTTVGSVNFGLGDNAVALLFAAGQNGIARTNVSSYNIGAYTLQANRPDTVVNTNADSASDSPNPFDTVTTLRDAIHYAGRESWFDVDKDNKITNVVTADSEVRFDKTFFTTGTDPKKPLFWTAKSRFSGKITSGLRGLIRTATIWSTRTASRTSSSTATAQTGSSKSATGAVRPTSPCTIWFCKTAVPAPSA